MKFEHKTFTIWSTMLSIVFFVSACVSKDTIDEAIPELPINQLDNRDQSPNFIGLYKEFSPSLENFSLLLKEQISTVSYQNYQSLLIEKLKKIEKKTNGKRIEPRVVYKEDISSRKYFIKKEWAWGNYKKSNIKRYYKLFKSPWKIYEYKVAYQFVDELKKDPRKMKTISKKSKKGKGKEVLLKSKQTTSNIVLYFYRFEGKSRIYIIDPDIFMKSVFLNE